MKTKYGQDKGRLETAMQNGIVIYKVFDLPVNKVWNALTEPGEFKKWWGPQGFTCPSSNM